MSSSMGDRSIVARFLIFLPATGLRTLLRIHSQHFFSIIELQIKERTKIVECAADRFFTCASIRNTVHFHFYFRLLLCSVRICVSHTARPLWTFNRMRLMFVFFLLSFCPNREQNIFNEFKDCSQPLRPSGGNCSSFKPSVDHRLELINNKKMKRKTFLIKIVNCEKCRKYFSASRIEYIL